MEATEPQSIGTEAERLNDLVNRLLVESREGVNERRAHQRNPFFTPVRISLTRNPKQEFSCFSRDISPTGIGLLHVMPIDLGEVVLTIPSKSLGDIRIRSEVMWCRPCGEGWYLSGIWFIESIDAMGS